jgi:alcohol dehydrogenase (cytochrome c)
MGHNTQMSRLDARATGSRWWSFGLYLAAAALMGGYLAAAQSGGDAPGIQPAPAFSGEVLSAHPTNGWLTNGGNLWNQRYSPLTEIDRANVADLKAVWRTHLDASGVGTQYSGESQPIVHEGVIYIPTGADDVFALSVETGEVLWKYQSRLNEAIDTVCCGWTSRGVALGEGKVYLGQLDGKLVALDQQTGELAWSVQAEPWQEGYTITSAPLYYEGLVITGFAGAEMAMRGRVKAFDAETGSLEWTFYVIPGPGETGHETWPQDTEAWRFGGGAVWQTPAVDDELGLLYFATSNANPDLNGSFRAGDNLFTSSVVAIEARTGEYRWHYQTVHHDIWDYDISNPIVLFDLTIDGVERQGLGAAGKTGWVYILDRTTGEPLIGIDERPVPQEPRQATSATQPYPRGDAFVPQSIDIVPEGFTLVNGGQIFTPFWRDPVVVRPSALGGANWPPSSYDPERQVLYLCANDRYQVYAHTVEVRENPEPGEERMGGVLAPQVPLGTQGIFSAMDMTTNRLLWQQRWADSCYSGSVATAGDVLFVGRNDGRFTALDTRDGSRLWEFQTGAGVNAPPSVFEHDGTQYVVVYSAGNLFAQSPRGDSVWLFSLDGTLGPAERPATADAGGSAVPPPVEGRAPDAALGRRVYTQACIFCHGSGGSGGHEGPSLVTAAAAGDADTIRGIVGGGGRLMPAFGSLLSPAELDDVAAYVAEELRR